MRKGIMIVMMLVLSVSANAQEKLRELGLMLEDYEYPFPVEYLTLDIQGQQLKMAYMDVKPQKPNGKTIMLLHGKNFNGAYWEQTARDLSNDGYRVVIPDQIGFGKSAKPVNIQYTFQLLAQNTKAVLDRIGVSKTSVLGHSMGGMLATRFALMYPEVTEKLILANPIGLEDWKLWVPYQSVDEWYQQELKQDYEKIKQYQLTFYYDNKWKPEYDKWVNILAGWTLNENYPVIAKNAALTYDMIFTQPVVYEFEKLKMPTLLIIGQRDRTALGKARAPKEVQDKLGNYPELGRETKKKIPKAQLTELDDVGHLPHIEAYDRFIKPLKDFLKK
ncbi:alpha/beta hydrolase [Flavobacterium coralii]|uniref:alpha/beta fold hydrolase n=1 Tax=Flavobacterium coralii TaxID=2838017 RepID=UPI000C646C23|nr:alpha/beta hydrolase [Flavobacterium sp.]|tara:strand:+ start:22302 stop:23297 length:996 start_codon:yes stop_codon:yes gene_type:complete